MWRYGFSAGDVHSYIPRVSQGDVGESHDSLIIAVDGERTRNIADFAGCALSREDGGEIVYLIVVRAGRRECAAVIACPESCRHISEQLTCKSNGMSMDNRRSREFVFRTLSADRLAGASFERFDDCSRQQMLWTSPEQHLQKSAACGCALAMASMTKVDGGAKEPGRQLQH